MKPKKMKKVSYLFLIVCLTVILSGSLALGMSKKGEKVQEITKITMASFPTEDAKEQLEHMEPMRKFLEKKLGIEVEFIVTSDYSGTIEAMRSKHVEVAWLGPFSYVLASKVAGAEAMAGGVRKSTGKTSYNSIVVTRADTGINTIEDLKGRSFAFLDPASTSGFLVPSNMFKKKGINPEKDFKNIIYAGSHTAVQLAVANGTVDAGADSVPSYNLMVEKGAIDPDKQKIIWTSEDIPPSPICVRGDLPQELKEKIKAAFLDPEAGKVTHAEGKMKGYAEVKDSDYDPLRQIARNLGLDLAKMK